MKYRLIVPLLVGLLSMMVPHYVQAQACQGVDLRSTLEASDLEKISKQAASIPNSQGRFWKIEKQGLPPSWLIGTMHVADERVRQLTKAEREAFVSASTLALELDEILEMPEAGLLQILQDYPQIFTYQESDVLKKTLPTPQFALFEETLKKRGLSYALLSRTKPWLIWMMLAVPPCMVAQQEIGRVAFDVHLGRLAQEDGKQIVGLEEMQEQLEAIDALSLNYYITSIIQLGALHDRLDDYYETMLSLYLDGDIGTIMPMMEMLMARDLDEMGLGDAEMPSKADMLSFETVLLDERNAIMAARAAPLLEQGNSFIAVGALHLVGETGLVEQFRRMGYQLTKIEYSERT